MTKDLFIGGNRFLVEAVHVRVVDVQRVGVVAEGLAWSNEAAARAGFVAERGLYLERLPGKLAVTVNFAPGQVGHDFFVRGAEHKGMPIAVPHTLERWAKRVPAPGGLPHVLRVQDRHVQFLAAEDAHRVAYRISQRFDGTPAERQVGPDAPCQRTRQRGTHEKLVAGEFGLSRGVTQGAAHELGKAHWRLSQT
jgi:hypothetical protein